MRTYPTELPSLELPDSRISRGEGTQGSARAALDGRKKGLFALLPFLGPAFIACVAYIWIAIACSIIILGLNLWLLYATFAPLFGWWLPG